MMWGLLDPVVNFVFPFMAGRLPARRGPFHGVGRRPRRRFSAKQAVLATALLVLAMSVVTTVLGAGTAGAVTPPTGTSPCTRAETRSAFGEFLVAFDRGDYSKLDSLFAAAPTFQWFSSATPGARLRQDARDRRSLLPYFRSRHRHGDRLKLQDFHFTGKAPHWSNFYFDLRRRSAGFRGGRWFSIPGKGAAVCDRGAGAQFIVISLGGPAPVG